MASNLEYAFMASVAYRSTTDVVNRLPIPETQGWTELAGSYVNLPSGFEAVSLQRGSEIVISFAGTAPGFVLTQPDWWTNFSLATGSGGTQLNEAVAYYLQIRAQNANATISFTGHSLGGGLASLLGVFLNKQAVTFDQAPFAASATAAVRDGILDYLHGIGYTDSQLSALAPELFDFVELTPQLSNNVTNLNVAGEILSSVPLNRIGTETHLTHGAVGASSIDLHSQTLLTSFLQDDAFRQVTFKLTELVSMLFDVNLYYRDPNGADRNFLNHLLRHQVGVVGEFAADQMLTRFTSDLTKVAQDVGLSLADADVAKALTAFALQMYYERDIAPDKELFSTVSGGIRFSRTDVADTLAAVRGYTLYFSNYLATLPGTERDLITSQIPYLTDWYIQAGSTSMNVTAAAQRAFMLGSSGQDSVTGGSLADILVGGGGNDALSGAADADVLLGGDGYDTYIYATGDGSDVFADVDHYGKIIFDGITITGGRRASGQTYYESNDGSFRYVLSGSTLAITKNGSTGSITVESFNNQRRTLGIYLDEDPSGPLPGPGGEGNNYNPESAIRRLDPLALDLDGDGFIGTVALEQSNVYFDLDGDGTAERTGWIRPEDGLLARDVNGNGFIENISEVFGGTTGDGFADLAAFDSNADGVIDAADPVFATLKVWQDANQDGISQTGEHKSLAYHQITSLSLAAVPTSIDDNGNVITATSTFIKGGVSHQLADVNLRTSATEVNPDPLRSTGGSFLSAANPEIFALPWLRGYGDVTDLHIAYDADPALRSLAQTLVSGPSNARR
jgi:hypothetical protein